MIDKLAFIRADMDGLHESSLLITLSIEAAVE